ncbi:Glycine-rich RNA-binding protein 3, mitochondrial [Mucuna pruriens]|uniref:Glycine-rich RNA-binding protein 3, mitochondrial n=1 Tax=Mucuna pruriens TaxID=157652 RepID=A0A371GSH1_MUCPR|nr:Glycine-rich RNA-binding protein 3, mitochondrial [Mucuna pruriens]
MAFFNKIGNLLKNSAVKHINQDFSVSTPSVFQAIRSMSSAKLFVGGISYSTDDMSLREAFARYGEVIDAKVIMDRETGRSRGFAFITFATSEDASSAIQGLDGQINLADACKFCKVGNVSLASQIVVLQDLHGRRVRVNYATERSRPGFGGGGGYGGGGYGGGGSYGDGNYGGNRGGSYGNSGYGVTNSYGGGGASNYEFSGDFGSAGGSNQNEGTGADNDEDSHARESNDEHHGFAQSK